MARNSAMYIRATPLSGSAPLPFVISTGAQRSGEISVWMLSRGKVLRPSVPGLPAPRRTTTYI